MTNLPAALPHLETAAAGGLVEAMMLAGSVNEDLGDFDRAETWYTRAATEGDTTSMFALGRFAFSRGDLSNAERWFAQAPGKTYGDHSGYGLLIQIAEQRGDPDAVAHWTAQGVAVNDPNALVRQSLNLLNHDRSHTRAMPLAGRAAAKNHPAGLYLMGMYCDQLGRRAEAVDWLKKAVGAGHLVAQEELDRIQRR